jgi:hypothetical protein
MRRLSDRADELFSPAGLQAGGELEFDQPLLSDRVVGWLSATQAFIQLSGLLVILHACLR